jgi:hypothetical protein
MTREWGMCRTHSRRGHHAMATSAAAGGAASSLAPADKVSRKQRHEHCEGGGDMSDKVAVARRGTVPRWRRRSGHGGAGDGVLQHWRRGEKARRTPPASHDARRSMQVVARSPGGEAVR